MKKMIIIAGVLAANLYAQSLTLDDAIRLALENNRNLKISQTSLQIADAQYNQALSARYPQINATASMMRMDEDPSFQMKGTFALPQDIANGLSLSGAATQDEITALSTGTNTHTNLMNTLGAVQSGSIPAQVIPLDMEVKQMDRDLGVLRLDAIYPIYTGGKIDAVIRQAALNKSIQVEGIKRSEADVIYDVKRYYYGAMLTKKIAQETQDTLERMRMVKDMTETFYKGESLKVKKTDFLRISTTVDLISSMDEEMKTNVELSKAALINAIGLPWNSDIEIADTAFSEPKVTQDLQGLIDDSYRYNPTYAQLKLAIDIYDAKIDEASSGYLPSVALSGNVQHLENSYDAGVVNKTNRDSWTIGVGLQWNLFEGFRTQNAVQEARLNKVSHEHKEVLLKEGLALQVKYAFMKMGQSTRQYTILARAKNTAFENADLNTRAYQEDMVETKDVIEAQLMETFTTIAYYKNMHDFSLSQAQLQSIIVGEASQNR